ncbi:MAG: hypothetical protein U0270_31145 [Labilithrix sp.]
MKKSLLLAASLLAVAALTGCSDDTGDETGSSSNDIVTGDQRDNSTNAAYGQKPEEPAPADVPGEAAEGTVSAKKLVTFQRGLQLKPALDFPKPPIETPAGSRVQLPHDIAAGE